MNTEDVEATVKTLQGRIDNLLLAVDLLSAEVKQLEAENERLRGKTGPCGCSSTGGSREGRL